MASSTAATGLPQYMGSPPTPWRDGDDRCSSPFPEKTGNFPDDESDSHFEFMEESPTRPALVRRRAEQLSQQRHFMSKFVAKDQTIDAFLRKVNREGLHRIQQRSSLEVNFQGEKSSDASPPRSDASRSSPARPAWIPPDAAYVEISDDESDKDLCPPPSDLDRDMTVPQVQLDDQDAFMPSTNTSEDERMDSSDDEAGGSVSPFSSASQQETPRTDVSDDALADTQLSPKFTPNKKSTEDIVFTVRDVIRGASSRKPESSSGYVYVLYDPSEETPFYKIGQSKDVERRAKQHNTNCRLETWTTRKSPKCTNYKTLEKLALAELKNLKYEPNCSCPTQHREYSWGEVADGLNIVRSWSRWLTEEEPFDDECNLKPFWADRLEAFTCGNLGSFNCMTAGCTKEAEEPQACQACLRKGWMTFTEPTSEDRFEYTCRRAISSHWVCWVLQTCHKCFPSYETRLASLVNWVSLGQQLWDSVSSIQLILVTLFIRGIYVTALACWNHGIDKSEFLDLFLDLFLAVIAAYRLFLVGTPTVVPRDEKQIRRVNGSRSPSRQFGRTASKSPGKRNPGSYRSPKMPRPSKSSGAEGENKVNSPNKEHSDEMKELPGEMLPASPLTPDRSLTRQKRKKPVRTG